jgi:hypothetical protein
MVLRIMKPIPTGIERSSKYRGRLVPTIRLPESANDLTIGIENHKITPEITIHKIHSIM